MPPWAEILGRKSCLSVRNVFAEEPYSCARTTTIHFFIHFKDNFSEQLSPTKYNLQRKEEFGLKPNMSYKRGAAFLTAAELHADAPALLNGGFDARSGA